MNDKEIFEDLLTSIKGECNLCMNATIESSNNKQNEVFNDTLFKTLQMQNDLYNTMKDVGWYTVNNVERSKIDMTKNKLSL